jgi:hypothetical protein
MDMGMAIGSGTFVKVFPSQSRKGWVEKRLRFTMPAERFGRLKQAHDSYVEEIGKCVHMPKTEMCGERMADGSFSVLIFQQDMRECGRLLADAMGKESAESGARRVGFFRKALEASIQAYGHALEARERGIRLGLESNPNNWWVMDDGTMAFLDTMPPLISFGRADEKDLLVMPDDPSFAGRLCAAIASYGPLAGIAERTIMQYAFDWPTSIRTFLVKAIDCAPDIGERLIDTARWVTKGLGDGFKARLSGASIWIELAKLKAYNSICRIGKGREKETG